MDWYPWYFDLYASDTMHLNPYQDGCYRRLIDHYMKTRQALPESDAALARIVGDSLENWIAQARDLVRPFFKLSKGRLYSKRCEDVLSAQEEKFRRRSEIGKNGAEKRYNKNKEIVSSGMPPTMLQDKTREDKRIESKKEADVVTRASASPEHVAVSKKVGQLTRLQDDPRWFGDFSRVEAWISAGWSPELDIYPTIERIMLTKGSAPRSIKYFEQAIADAHALRLSPVAKGNAKNADAQRQPTRNERNAAAMRAAARELNEQIAAGKKLSDL